MTFIPVVPPRVSSPLVDPTSRPRMFVLPDLVSHCPYDWRVNEELPRAVWESKAWMINGSNVGRSEKTLNLLHGLKGGGLSANVLSTHARWTYLVISSELACACYPLAPLRKVRACCDFTIWLFNLDDISDDMDDKNTVAIGNEIMTAYRQPHAYDPKSHVGKLTKWFAPLTYISTELTIRSSSFWTRITAESSPGFQKRFIHTMSLSFKAVVTQAYDRATGVIPNLEDYIVVRRDTSGCKPCLALIEYANGWDLPDEVMEHRIIQSLDEAVNDLVSWSNVSIRTRLFVFPGFSLSTFSRTSSHTIVNKLKAIHITLLQ